MSANPLTADLTHLPPAPDPGLLDGQALAQAQQPAPPAAPRRRPLGRFTDMGEGPNFCLSLSDLMCLLIVCFVLIYSLTDAGAPTPALQHSPHLPVKAGQGCDGRHPHAGGGPLPQYPARVGPGGLGLGPGGRARPGRPRSSGPGSPLPGIAGRLTPGRSVRPRPLNPGGQRRALSDDEPTLGSLLGQGSGPEVEVEQGARRMLLRLPESITFGLAKAEIKPCMSATLGRLAELLSHHPSVPVTVTGHAGDLSIRGATFASNWELSAARAATVGRVLMAQGLGQSRLTIRGLANRQLRQSNTDEASCAQSRRVQIELRLDGQG